MQPTLSPPNEFELAILYRLAVKVPALVAIIPRFRVLRREFTPCGSYTDLECPDTVEGAANPISTSEAINVPGVTYGMQGLLFFKDGRPDFLEIVAFGGESWDVRYDGFSIQRTA